MSDDLQRENLLALLPDLSRRVSLAPSFVLFTWEIDSIVAMRPRTRDELSQAMAQETGNVRSVEIYLKEIGTYAILLILNAVHPRT